MNCLEEIRSGILSSQKDLDLIEKQESAKFLVLSDSHGAYKLVNELIKKSGPQCDGLIFCGDGITDLFYNLQQGFENKKYMKCLPPLVAFVQGNNDTSSLQNYFSKEKNRISIPTSTTFTACGKKIFVTHGHKFSVYYGTEILEHEAQSHEANAAIFGHTHIPFEQLRSVYLLNPGSVDSPRGGSSMSFSILEITKNSLNAIFYKISLTAKGIETTPYFPTPYYI